MKNLFYLNIYLFFVFLPSLYHLKFASLNQLIDVGKDIYCQHDENNETIFPVKKSGKQYTTVYKTIIPTITASKLWLKNGTLIDCDVKPAIGATNKNDYIAVKEGEQYFFRIYGMEQKNAAPVLFLDENDNYVKDFFRGLYTESKKGVELTVPAGAKKMHITSYNAQSLTIQKILNMTDNEIDKLCINETTITEKINNLYMEYIKNPIVYKKINKAYITFVLDGTRPEDEDNINLFIKKGIPLSLAPIPERFIENTLSGKKTLLNIIQELIATGKGEILSLGGMVLTEDNLGNFSEMYTTFIKTKQMFNFYGMETNGIIFRGHGGNIKANEIMEKWASAFYGFSDLYGVPINYPDLLIDSVYFHPRTSLFSYKDIEQMKEAIDKDINESNYHIIEFNSGVVNGTLENLDKLLDYVKQKEKEGKLIIGNYKDFYEKNAVRINEIIKNKQTYYVASDGKSKDGLSEKNPMNIETLKTKKFKSGDTILFKRGDTFFGPLNINPIIVDDTMLTLSAYGDSKKEKPILTCFKIVNKKESWEKETDNIYRIDLTNTSKFSGLNDTTPESTRIGYLLTNNKTKYYNVKTNMSSLIDLYDFYTNESHLFIRTNGSTPYEELGELKMAPRIKILIIHSNTKVENLHILGSGCDGIRGRDITKNVEIVNNIIEDIGGSFHYIHDERYGNAITFFETEAANLKIHKNIIKNIYDVAFTIQGERGGAANVTVTKNIFIFNSQDSEIWETYDAKGVYNYTFEDNISFMQGRGWGYSARPDQYCAGHILFWGYNFENVVEKTNISFSNNYVYNPRRLYYIADHGNTNILFQKENCIRSDFNHYYLNNDSFIYCDKYKYPSRNSFIQDFNKDNNSEFILLDKEEQILVEKFSNSYDYRELRKLFVDDVDDEDNKDDKDNSNGALIAIVVIILIVLSIVGGIFIYRYIRKKKDTSSLESINNEPLVYKY